jgi:hypothetical protein
MNCTCAQLEAESQTLHDDTDDELEVANPLALGKAASKFSWK